MPLNPSLHFESYFDLAEDYLDPTKLVDLALEQSSGWKINYISSTFLNGWINYTKIFAAFALSRYRPSHELAQKIKQLEETNSHHTDFSVLRDDTILLAQDKSGLYWYFYYDQDVSDCSIGRFHTPDPKETIITKLKNYLSPIQEDLKKFSDEQGDGTLFELNPSLISGWVKG